MEKVSSRASEEYLSVCTCVMTDIQSESLVITTFALGHWLGRMNVSAKQASRTGDYSKPFPTSTCSANSMDVAAADQKQKEKIGS
jgi:hypothetical protein